MKIVFDFDEKTGHWVAVVNDKTLKGEHDVSDKSIHPTVHQLYAFKEAVSAIGVLLVLVAEFNAAIQECKENTIAAKDFLSSSPTAEELN